VYATPIAVVNVPALRQSDDHCLGEATFFVVKITKGTPHVHTGYDEVYYVLAGTGTITVGQETHPLRPGSVAVIPAGVPHSLAVEPRQATLDNCLKSGAKAPTTASDSTSTK
jgi:mannose-6-phosphate isomerase-like protein (cupin superfamily)